MAFENLKVNILKVPLAIFHFFTGAVATYISWELLPTLFTSLTNAGIGDYPIIIQIGWFGAIMLSIIYMLVYPLWILFEEEEDL